MQVPSPSRRTNIFHFVRLDNGMDGPVMVQCYSMLSDTVDGGYAWVIVAAVFTVHFFILGTIYTFGFFYTEYLDAFDDTKGGEIAWVGSICAGSTLAFAGYTGAMADRYGNGKCICIGGMVVFISLMLASLATEVWHLFVTQGLMCGLGYSLSFVGAISVMDQWFDRRRGLGVGIAVSGSGFGQVGLAPITSQLLRSQGWRRTLRWLAFLTAVGIITSGFFVKRRIPLVSYSKPRSFLTKLRHHFSNKNFTVMYAAMFLTSMGYMMPFTHIVKYAEIVGISSSRAVLIVSLIGMSSAIGRTSLGQVADRCNRLTTFRVCLFMGGVATFAWIACREFSTLVVYAVLFGYFAGGFVSLQPVVCSELFQGQDMGEVMGLVYTSSTAGNLFSAPLGGVLYDVTGGYTLSIVVAGVFMTLGSILTVWLRVPVLRKLSVHDDMFEEQNQKEFELIPTAVVSDMNDLNSSSHGNGDAGNSHRSRLIEDGTLNSSSA